MKEKEFRIKGEKNVETELLRNYRKEYKEQHVLKFTKTSLTHFRTSTNHLWSIWTEVYQFPISSLESQ